MDVEHAVEVRLSEILVGGVGATLANVVGGVGLDPLRKREGVLVQRDDCGRLGDPIRTRFVLVRQRNPVRVEPRVNLGEIERLVILKNINTCSVDSRFPLAISSVS